LNQPIRCISAAEIRQALPMKQAIEAMREAFVLLTQKQVHVPPRIHLDAPQHNGATLTMPVSIPGKNRIGVKFLSLYNDNPKKNGLPGIQALMILMDAENGRPLALMDGASLTALRTGAASGVATDLLARHDAETVAIFGAGAQGRTQLEAVCAVRKISHAFVFNRSRQRAAQFATEMSEQLGIEVTVAKSSDALRQTDIICAATNSAQPVLADCDIRSGVHINAIGSYKPHIREIPGETVTRARVFVDCKESCLTEAGDILIPLQEGLFDEKHILGEIGELVLSRKKGRANSDEITLFKSVGNAAQDLVAADKIWIATKKLNLGSEIFL